MKHRFPIVVLLASFLIAGCQLGAKKTDTGMTVTYRVGVEEYPLLSGEAHFVAGQAGFIDSAVLSDAVKVAKAAASGGGNIIVEVVEFTTQWLR